MPDHPPTISGADAPSRGPIRDDAGHKAKLLSIRDLKRAAQTGRPSLRFTANRLQCAIKSERANMTAGSVIRTLVSVIAVFFFTSVFTTMFHIIFPGYFHPAVVTLTILILMIVAVSVVNKKLTLRLIRRNLASTAVAEGACGSCAHSLEGLPSITLDIPCCGRCGAPTNHPSKCRACGNQYERPVHKPSETLSCSECGSTWLRSRVTRPHWAQPVHESIRPLWYTWILPGIRSYSTSMTPDDRGRFVYVPDARLLRVPPKKLAELGETRRSLCKGLRHAGWGWRVPTALPTAALAGLFVNYFVYELRQPRIDTVAAWAAAIIVTIFMIPTVITVCSALGRPPKIVARRLVAKGLCGSCLTRLEGLQRDRSHLVECPTCGASWAFKNAARASEAEPSAPRSDLPSPDAD